MTGPLKSAADRDLFKAMYASKRYSTEDIASLFSLTVARTRSVARELDVRRPKSGHVTSARKPENDRIDERVERKCNSCGKSFMANGKFNRLCHDCRNPQSEAGFSNRRLVPYPEMPRFASSSTLGPAPTCQFIVDDNGVERFCGKPSLPGHSWCRGHCAVVYTPEHFETLIREPRA